MSDKEKCVNVDLSTTHADVCKKIAERAVMGWEQQGIGGYQIEHVLKHKFPGIWPSFATREEITSIKEQAAKELNICVSKVQVDGIRIDGLVNLLVKL